MKDSTVVGIDIGGSHLTAALVNIPAMQFVTGSHTRIRVNSKGSAERILVTWSNEINNLLEKFNLTEKKIGIAMPGPFDYENGISLITGLDKYESLYKLNVKERLAEQLVVEPASIRMMNDAACFLRGEVYGGAATGYRTIIGVTLGTGTGSAVHHNGITKDANLGPSPFMDSIADNYFSTRWFVNRYKELSGELVTDVKEIAERYTSEENVKKLFSEFVANFTVFLEEFVKREKPEAIVIGGNIANCSELFLTDLEIGFRVAGVTIPIVKAQLGEDAAILGAASLCRENF